MTGEAFGAGRGCLVLMLDPKALVVRGRFHVVVVARREGPRSIVQMAESAVRHAISVRQAMAGFVTANAVEHLRQF